MIADYTNTQAAGLGRIDDGGGHDPNCAGCEKCYARVQRERDAARAELARWRMLIEDAQAALAEAGYREHKHTPASAIRGLTAERDEARAELTRLKEVHLHGCECSTDEACAFAQERDRALALLRKTRTHAPLGTHRWATLLAEIDALLGE